MGATGGSGSPTKEVHVDPLLPPRDLEGFRRSWNRLLVGAILVFSGLGFAGALLASKSGEGGVLSSTLVLVEGVGVVGTALAALCALALPTATLVSGAFFDRRAITRRLAADGAAAGVLAGIFGATFVTGDGAFVRLVGALLVGVGVVAVVVAVRNRRAPRGASPGTLSFVLAFVVLLLGVHAVVDSRYHSRERAYVTVMRADLEHLREAQELHRRRHGRFAARLDELEDFSPAFGVVNPEVSTAGEGWSARVRHQGTSVECAITVGMAPVAPARREGEPGCTQVHSANAPAWAGFLGLGFLVAGATLGGLAVRAPRLSRPTPLSRGGGARRSSRGR